MGIRVSRYGTEYVEPNEEDARIGAVLQAHQDQMNADKARLGEIKASTFLDNIETAMRGKTYAEISAFIDGMTAAQRDAAFKGLLLKWALEVK